MQNGNGNMKHQYSKEIYLIFCRDEPVAACSHNSPVSPREGRLSPHLGTEQRKQDDYHYVLHITNKIIYQNI